MDELDTKQPDAQKIYTRNSLHNVIFLVPLYSTFHYKYVQKIILAAIMSDYLRAKVRILNNKGSDFVRGGTLKFAISPFFQSTMHELVR